MATFKTPHFMAIFMTPHFLGVGDPGGVIVAPSPNEIRKIDLAAQMRLACKVSALYIKRLQYKTYNKIVIF